jgi:hypothetical protein
MSDGVDLSFDAAQIARDADRVVRRYLSIGTEAVAETTKGLERRLESITRAAVPGDLWKAWKSQTFPRSGPARDPVGTVFVNGGTRSKGAITFWTQPGAVRGKAGQYLAIPLPAAGSRGRGRDLTPGEWERRTGQRLQFVYRQGRASLLVAVGGTINGRSGAFRPLTGRRVSKGRGGDNPLVGGVIPIFVLIPVVPFRNAVAVEPQVAAAEQDLVRVYLQKIGR